MYNMYSFPNILPFISETALFRRATAFVSLKEWRKSEKDLLHILQLEPGNKKAQELLSQSKKEIVKLSENDGTKKKGRRVQIEEVEEEEDEGSSKTSVTPPTTDQMTNSTHTQATPQPAAGHHVTVTPTIPSEVLELKEKGNDLYQRGQYGEALIHYTKAIQILQKGNVMYMYMYVFLPTLCYL